MPVKLIVYKGFGHGLNKPKAARAAQEHNLEWFAKYVWGEGTPTTSQRAADLSHGTPRISGTGRQDHRGSLARDADHRGSLARDADHCGSLARDAGCHPESERPSTESRAGMTEYCRLIPF